MRCENCGWDNSVENVKCEKCNTPLGKSSSVAPQAVQPFSEGGFDSGKTQKGCSGCGYPVRPGDSRCPQCGCVPGGSVPNEKAAQNNPQRKTGKLAGFLVTYSNNPLGEFFPLYEGINTVGRNATNTICIDDENISGEHLTIAYYSADKKFYFEPARLTTNGTFVNEVFFPNKGGELKNLDMIRIGSNRLIFMAIPSIE